MWTKKKYSEVEEGGVHSRLCREGEIEKREKAGERRRNTERMVRAMTLANKCM